MVIDHKSWCHLSTLNTIQDTWQGHLLILSKFEADIIYKQGKLNVDGDCLSREPVKNSVGKDNDDDDDELPLLMINEPNLSDLQDQESKCANIEFALTNPDNDLSLSINRVAKIFLLIDGVVYKKNLSEQGFPNLLAVPKANKK